MTFFKYRVWCIALFLIILSAQNMRGQDTAPAASDTLQMLNKLKLEQEALRNELDSLTLRIDAMSQKYAQSDTGKVDPQMDSQLKSLIKSKAELEYKLGILSDKIIRAQPEMDTFHPVAEDSSKRSDNSSISWGDDDEAEPGADDSDGQFDLKMDFNKKYSSSFPLPFPVMTPFGQTFLRYNRVEGLYLGVGKAKKLYWNSKPKIVGIGSAGYGFLNHRWRYSLGLYLPLYLENQIIEFGGEGHSFTDSKDSWIIDRDENTTMAFFAREDFMDYFSREGFSITTGWYMRDMSGINTKAVVAYLHDSYKNMDKKAKWSLFGGDKVFRPQPYTPASNINSIELILGMSTLPASSYTNSGWNIEFTMENAGGFAKGDFDFTQMVLDARRFQPLTAWLNLNLRARFGASDGIVPFQRQFEIGGVSTLPGYHFKEFYGSHVGLFNAEIIFNGSNAVETEGWVQTVLSMANIIFFFDAGSTNSNSVTAVATEDVTLGSLDASFKKNFVLNNWKTDIGFAFGNPDGSTRIGIAWALDKPSVGMLVLRFSRPF
jgi:hypothetical protein